MATSATQPAATQAPQPPAHGPVATQPAATQAPQLPAHGPVAIPPAVAPPPSTVRSDELRTKFVELEYNYLTESSFHSDHLRNQFIQFYLLIAGVAATVIAALMGAATAAGNIAGIALYRWSGDAWQVNDNLTVLGTVRQLIEEV